MKAIVQEEYGSPDVLEVRDVEQPIPDVDQVLVKVHAVATNPADWHLMRADPAFVRLMFGMIRPKFPTLGSDIAGVVEAVGDNVTEFKPGDEVFGSLFLKGFGGWAEYVVAHPENLVLKPAHVTFLEAASVPIAGVTALQGLRDHGRIKAGRRVMINGASGGVGTFAVQIARHFGAEVTAVCSTRNLELVERIGADNVIDYTHQDYSNTDEQYDLLLDTVGNAQAYRRFFQNNLTPEGIAVIIAGSVFLEAVEAPLRTALGTKTLTAFTAESSNKNHLKTLQGLLDTGSIIPVIDRCCSLEEVPEAICYLETGRARGKVMISVVA